MGAPFWTEEEKNYFLKEILPRSIYASGRLNLEAGRTFEDLAVVMQRDLDSLGLSKRQYSGQQLFQHYYQKCRPGGHKVYDPNPSRNSAHGSQALSASNRPNIHPDGAMEDHQASMEPETHHSDATSIPHSARPPTLPVPIAKSGFTSSSKLSIGPRCPSSAVVSPNTSNASSTKKRLREESSTQVNPDTDVSPKTPNTKTAELSLTTQKSGHDQITHPRRSQSPTPFEDTPPPMRSRANAFTNAALYQALSYRKGQSARSRSLASPPQQSIDAFVSHHSPAAKSARLEQPHASLANPTSVTSPGMNPVLADSGAQQTVTPTPAHPSASEQLLISPPADVDGQKDAHATGEHLERVTIRGTMMMPFCPSCLRRF